MHIKRIILLLGILLLTQCGGDESTPENGATVSGARSAVLSWGRITGEEVFEGIRVRPSPMLGIWTSMFLSQKGFLPARSALLGIEAQQALQSGQSNAVTDETFELLQEFGSVLQVDVNDMLNRQTDRAAALQQYITTLKNIGEIVQRKNAELETQLDELQDRRREQRSVVNDLERSIRNALQDEDYAAAGAKQQEVTEAQSTLAEIETRASLTRDILRSYENLLEIGVERLVALEKNREVLIAGVKVVDVPGVENLGLLEKESRRGRGNAAEDDIFGTDILQ